MAPRDSTRPGSTPIIRFDGDTIVYQMWIGRENGRCEMLVVRCAPTGDVLASIEGDRRERNHHTRVQSF
jgi:hypothetical protein